MNGPDGTLASRDRIGAWLASHPDALVGAVNERGGTVDMPGSVPLGSRHEPDSRSLLDLVVPEDSRAVTDAFVTALARGHGVTTIHMSSDPTRPHLLQYLDLRAAHGVILRLVVPRSNIGDDPGSSVRAADLTPTRSRLCVIVKSEVGTIEAIDEATTALLGWGADEMVGHSSLDFIHPDDHVRAIDNWMNRLTYRQGHTVQTVRVRFQRKDDTWIWMEASNDFQTRDDGTTVVLGQMIDVSEEMAATEALRVSEHFLRRLTDTVPVGLFQISRDGTVDFVNPVLRELIGGADVTTKSDLSNAMSPDSRVLDSAIGAVIADGVDFDLDVNTATDGSRRLAKVTLTAVKDEGTVLGVIGCVVDVTELKSLADTDGLTGLQNRRSIVEVLESELVAHSGRVSVIFADLKGFKQVNDRYGHQTGDQLLAEVADRLRSAVRPGDCIGRLGGDEFLVFCPGMTNRADAEQVADRLRNALKGDFRIGNETLRVVASLGVACGGPGATADALISMADTEMYRDKQKQYAVTPIMEAR